MEKGPVRSGYIAILSAVLIWAGWMVSTRFLAMGVLSPYDISALRFLVAGVALAPVLPRLGFGIGPYGFWGGMLLSILMGPLYIIVCTTGMRFAPASHAAAIINGFMVMTSTLLGVYWLQEPFFLKKKIGIALLLSGIACVAYARTGGNASVGHLFFALGGVMWACYGICLRKWHASPWHATVLTSVLSAIWYLPVYYFFLPSRVVGASPGLIVFHGVYQGLLTAVLALFLYGKAVHALGASTAAAFVPLVPILTVLLGMPLLGEIPGPLEIAGISLVFIGLMTVIVTFKRRGKKEPKLVI